MAKGKVAKWINDMYLCIYRVEVELYAVWRLSAPRRRWQWRLWVQRIRVSVSAAADMLFCIPSKPKRILFRCIYVFVGTMQLYKYHQSIYSDLIGWATVWRNNGCGQKQPNGNTLNFIHLVLRTQYFLYFFPFRLYGMRETLQEGLLEYYYYHRQCCTDTMFARLR